MELRDLRTGFRGYQKEDVARLVGERDQRCASLQQELERLRARLTEQEQLSGPESGEAIAAALISAQADSWLSEARAEAERLLTEAREEAARLRRETEDELLRQKQEAVQMLAAADRQAAEEAERIAQARACAEEVRRRTREALMQLDSLMSGMLASRSVPDSFAEESSGSEVEEEPAEDGGDW